MEKIQSGVAVEGDLGDVVEAIAKALKLHLIGDKEVPIEHAMSVASEIIGEMSNRLEKIRFNMGAIVMFCKAAGFPQFQDKTEAEISASIQEAINRHDDCEGCDLTKIKKMISNYSKEVH